MKKLSLIYKIWLLWESVQRDNSVCDAAQSTLPCPSSSSCCCTPAEEQHENTPIWWPRRCRMPQNVGYSEESPCYDVQPGAARALESIWNRHSVHEPIVDTRAIKTKTATTKGHSDNKPFQSFHCLYSWSRGSHSCAGEGRGIRSDAARYTKRVTADPATGIMWPLHIQGGAQDVAPLLITWSERPTKSFILSWRKLCYSNVHKLGKCFCQSTRHEQETLGQFSDGVHTQICNNCRLLHTSTC